jgi:hypothetical protein
MTTILFGGEAREAPGAVAAGGALWVPVEGLEAATGWHLEPEGLCFAERCFPLPPGQALLREGRLDFAGFARHAGFAVARHADSDTWAFVEAPGGRGPGMVSTIAPDFTLPDLEGREHTLTAYRGRKVFLVSWASW